MNDGLYVLECIVINFNITHCFPHSRDHTEKVFYITHFLDLIQLIKEIVEVEGVLS